MADETADCLFCRVVAGDLPSDVVHRGDRVLAFRDIDPQAPTHVLVVPLQHHPDVGAIAASDPAALAELVAAAEQIAHSEGHDDFRLVFNTGARAGQSVFHVHGHVLAGRAMTWPPG
jgi:histidine triad (HIT) family protein